MIIFLLALKIVLFNSTYSDSYSFFQEMLDRPFFCIEYYCECINLFLPLSSYWNKCILMFVIRD